MFLEGTDELVRTAGGAIRTALSEGRLATAGYYTHVYCTVTRRCDNDVFIEDALEGPIDDTALGWGLHALAVMCRFDQSTLTLGMRFRDKAAWDVSADRYGRSGFQVVARHTIRRGSYDVADRGQVIAQKKVQDAFIAEATERNRPGAAKIKVLEAELQAMPVTCVTITPAQKSLVSRSYWKPDRDGKLTWTPNVAAASTVKETYRETAAVQDCRRQDPAREKALRDEIAALQGKIDAALAERPEITASVGTRSVAGNRWTGFVTLEVTVDGEKHVFRSPKYTKLIYSDHARLSRAFIEESIAAEEAKVPARLVDIGVVRPPWWSTLESASEAHKKEELQHFKQTTPWVNTTYIDLHFDFAARRKALGLE